ncbi:MAG: PLD nuclease N-terminal domain-containing protein [Thermomicrobiales bacterium]
MNLTTTLGAVAIIALGSLQYLLMANGIRDLLRRPRVRGGNKVLWGLVILCLPIGGALIYGWMGPTSFLSRPQSRSDAGPRPQPQPDPAPNITPIGHARSVRTSRPQQPLPPPTRIRRTGS